jgi:cation diffusion facilitator CzcD-associated flavoprotein CzcO
VVWRGSGGLGARAAKPAVAVVFGGTGFRSSGPSRPPVDRKGNPKLDQTDIAIVGAGPHGLAAAAHLRRSGADCRIFGKPMSFWQGMPSGMLLRSNWTATCVAEYEGPLSLDSYCAAAGISLATPIPLDRFIEYGMWVQQQVAPDVDQRLAVSVEPDGDGFHLTFADGDRLRANRVVIAAGIAPFAHRPAVMSSLGPESASHTADHRDLGRFGGSQVLVVGGGQSALESAALLHEAGAEVAVVARADHLNWLHGGKYHRMLGRFAKLVYAPTDVGPMGISRIVAVPGLVRAIPRPIRGPMSSRAIRPAGAAWLKPRLRKVPIHLGRSVRRVQPTGSQLHVELDDGNSQVVDHLLFGTGYRVDIRRYPFLSPTLVSRINCANGYPILNRGMESSVPRLHFLGAPAAHSFGPIMRFVAGGWYAAESLTRVVNGNRPAGHETVAPQPAAGR